jgi:hypothetical protein
MDFNCDNILLVVLTDTLPYHIVMTRNRMHTILFIGSLTVEEAYVNTGNAYKIEFSNFLMIDY